MLLLMAPNVIGINETFASECGEYCEIWDVKDVVSQSTVVDANIMVRLLANSQIVKSFDIELEESKFLLGYLISQVGKEYYFKLQYDENNQITLSNDYSLADLTFSRPEVLRFMFQ